jgi:hypothetical protein
MYQYSFFHTYVDCHVTKNKVQAGAVTDGKLLARVQRFLGVNLEDRQKVIRVEFL